MRSVYNLFMGAILAGLSACERSPTPPPFEGVVVKEYLMGEAQQQTYTLELERAGKMYTVFVSDRHGGVYDLEKSISPGDAVQIKCGLEGGLHPQPIQFDEHNTASTVRECVKKKTVTSS